ncbi:MAG TPA: chemotaxis-specific protein-glutamate methyltransferase CheB [Thermoanaerobaculia bacterium]|nr:chemotaxis-specific protein-glutamate methyltransferase CheB [Thermoanaerobaculia bacterium]
MIKALIIDDSAYNRVTLSRMLASSDGIEVVGTAVNGEDGIKQVLRHKPDVITLDLEMPVMDGFAFLRWLMANRPTPVIAVSSRANDRSVFKALELGAVDFVAKPGGRVSARLDAIREDLIAKALQSGQVHLRNVAIGKGRVTPLAPKRPPVDSNAARELDLIVIGASTGGPPAIQLLFESVDLLPIPFVIAQHMPAAFTRLFAERIDKLTRYKVTEGADGDLLVPGHVLIAPGGMQTEVVCEGDVLSLRVTARSSGDIYAPSVNRLFSSASESCGARLMAILLTGMGDDGADGIRLVKSQGGKTIAESEESAVIFGMPAEAIRTGSVDEVLPLANIAEAIERLCFCSPPVEQSL